NAPANPPPSLKRDLDRAAAMVASLAQDLEDFLRAELEREGFNPSTSSPRFALALDLMTGRRERNPGPQQPRMFFLPGLAEHGFYPRDKLAWLPALEAATSTLKGELSNVLSDTGSFAPYVMPETNAPQRDYQGMAGNQDWSAYYLWKNGAEVPANMAQCPQTTAILSQMPLCDMPQRAPMALFSWLKPGARIPPHQGMMNTRLICHLPLIVPADCGFRVGAETRSWQEGHAWAFDDTYDHEAWNRSADLRVILIFDVWRPDVTPEERHLIRSMLAAIDTYAGVPPRWEI
ncbi:MAG TPA: asparaginyl beta-hydroxylase, partial [Alphaproteobacteria bacterium]|nr:asparaginyl beta-hydroxylase [Alphaproteobacteria bacterium]